MFLRCEYLLCTYCVLVKGFVVLDGLCEWDIYNLVVLETYHDVTLTFEQGIDGCNTQTACKDAVVGSRAAATLQVAED